MIARQLARALRIKSAYYITLEIMFRKGFLVDLAGTYLQTNIADFSTAIEVLIISENRLIRLYGFSCETAKCRTVIKTTLTIDVGKPSGDAVRIANHNDAAHSRQWFVFELVESCLDHRRPLGVTKKKVFLVRTVFETVLDDVGDILCTKSDILINRSGVNN